ncbi:unnamed protein product, partial [Pylaiella littoralis]
GGEADREGGAARCTSYPNETLVEVEPLTNFAQRAGCRVSVAILAAPRSRAMVWQAPRRLSSALDTPRPGWWTSSASSAPTVAASSSRAMV